MPWEGLTVTQSNRVRMTLNTLPHRARGLLLAFVLAGVILPAVAANSPEVEARLDRLFGVHEPYRIFLQDLQSAVARDERDQVAALVSYPLRTRLKGKSLRLTTPAQFLGHYDELLPPKTRADRECVLRDALRQQSGRHDR